MHVISENPKNKTTSIKAKKPMKTSSNATHVDTNGTVSWHVPRTGKKKRDHHHHLGFNEDYAVPRTHPPSHN